MADVFRIEIANLVALGVLIDISINVAEEHDALVDDEVSDGGSTGVVAACALEAG